MRTMLELVRIILIFMLLGGILGGIVASIYTTYEVSESYAWLGGIAILLLLFVLYRNKLQFSSWSKGEGKEKLPKAVSTMLIIMAILLFFTPFFLDFLTH